MPTPIYKMLDAYRNGDPLPFHMPGHLLGKGLPDELKPIGGFDITEIPGSDCLHAPEGVIKEAQELAAVCFGAGQTLFLVNGSTAGVHAMIQSCVQPGGKLIVGRDCHRSVLNALAVLGAVPVFVGIEVDEESQIPLSMRKDALEEAILSNPDAQGILLTRPNYYGVAVDLDEIVALAKKYNLPLLVDEAHGAHFAFHEAFPAPALKAGSDLCVQSLHKTMPALNQTALLHIHASGRVEGRRVQAAASMHQTTSPSYLLMASIDMARNIMENRGRELYRRLYERVQVFNEKLLKIGRIKRAATSFKGCQTDFSRIVLSFKETGLSGFAAESQLRTCFGIVAEMADFEHVVLIATPFHDQSDFDRLVAALEEISKERTPSAKPGFYPKWPYFAPDQALPLREAIFHPQREVPIEESEGAVCASFIIPYPPGIPLINPGERIKPEALEYIKALLRENGKIHGLENGRLRIADI